MPAFLAMPRRQDAVQVKPQEDDGWDADKQNQYVKVDVINVSP